MLIAITGTPGTGKTTVADELFRRGYKIIHVTDTIENYVVEIDKKRDTRVIDTNTWAIEFVNNNLRDSDACDLSVIVEGQISHYLQAEITIVLRCRPDIIGKRLTKRGYSPEKVNENVEAELVDVILMEAIDENCDQIFEIDTTSLSVPELADKIEHIIAGEDKPIYGIVDWLSVCQDLL